MLAHQRADEPLGAVIGQELPGDREVLLVELLADRGDLAHEPLLIDRAHLLGGRHRAPLHLDGGGLEHALGLAPLAERDEHEGNALVPSAPGAPAAVLQHLGVARQVRVEHQLERRQVEAAGGDVGRHQHSGLSVAQRLERPDPLGLRQLAADPHGLEAALGEARLQVSDPVAGRAEDERPAGLEVAQRVDDRVLALAPGDGVRPVLDVLVRLLRRVGREAHRVALVLPGELGDALGDGRREEQRAPVGRRVAQDPLELLAKAHVEHLVGLVEHQGAKLREVELLVLEVIAQPARSADDEVGTGGELALLAAHVHAADTGAHDRVSVGEQPRELALHLQGELAGRGDHQAERRGRGTEGFAVLEQLGGQREPEGDGLARTGLGRDEEVSAQVLGLEDERLDWSRLLVPAAGEGSKKRCAGLQV